MRQINRPLKTVIAHVGQSYVDEPVFVEVSKVKPLDQAVAAAMSRHIAPLHELSHYNHTRLRWVKPGTKCP